MTLKAKCKKQLYKFQRRQWSFEARTGNLNPFYETCPQERAGSIYLRDHCYSVVVAMWKCQPSRFYNSFPSEAGNLEIYIKCLGF